MDFNVSLIMILFLDWQALTTLKLSHRFYHPQNVDGAERRQSRNVVAVKASGTAQGNLNIWNPK